MVRPLLRRLTSFSTSRARELSVIGVSMILIWRLRCEFAFSRSFPPTLSFTMASEEAKADIKVATPGFDARFPNTNQTKNCWQNYVDFFACVKAKEAKNESTDVCNWFSQRYKSFCPNSWVNPEGRGHRPKINDIYVSRLKLGMLNEKRARFRANRCLQIVMTVPCRSRM